MLIKMKQQQGARRSLKWYDLSSRLLVAKMSPLKTYLSFSAIHGPSCTKLFDGTQNSLCHYSKSLGLCISVINTFTIVAINFFQIIQKIKTS